MGRSKKDCNIARDRNTGKSKGYGFILFKHRSSARKAIMEPQKRIGTRMTACQMASDGPVQQPAPPLSEYTRRKIYVSNVGEELDPAKLLTFFSRYGEIEEGPLGLDKMTGKPRGFALFVYRTVESARKALEEPHKNFEGHMLFCRKAVDGLKPHKQGWQHQSWGAHNTHIVPFATPGGAVGSGAQISQFSGARDNAGFGGGMGTPMSPSRPGHLMAPSGGGLGFNQGGSPAAAAMAGINPALGQALTALLAPAADLGLANLLGSIGSAGVMDFVGNQAMPGSMVNGGGHGIQGGYANQALGVSANMSKPAVGGYEGYSQAPSGYGTYQMGQGSDGTGQQASYIGGVPPYVGH